MLKKIIFSIIVLASFYNGKAQTISQLQQVGYLLEDALFYSKQYIIPATDGAVYQASGAWNHSNKKRKTWDLSMGLNVNMFNVPKTDRTFVINNSDFKFFQIENGDTSVTVPTAMGNDNQIYLVGTIDGQQIRLKTPQGIDQQLVVYPYLDINLALPFGTELLTRTSTNTKLKKGYYQVYGYGLKHNLSQYFPKLESRNIYFSALAYYSKEDISFDFLDINTNFGSLGINQINGLVDTFHFQLSGSKQVGKVEIIGSFICNTSKFNYKVSGEKGTIENVFPIQSTINKLLDTIEKDKINYVGEVAANYQIKRFNVVTSFAFGKFMNGNIGIQYKVN